MTSAGPTGYPDGQRVQQWQNLSSVWSLTGNQTGRQSSGWIFAGNYGYLFAQMLVAGFPVDGIVQWANDPAGAQALGRFRFALDPNITTAGLMSLPLGAPYFQVSLSPALSSTVFTPTAYFYLTNQVRPNVLTQALERLALFNGNIAANATQTVYPDGYASGSCGLYTFGGTQGVTVTVQYMDAGTLTYQNVDRYKIANGADDYRTVVLPVGATRFLLANTSTTTQNTGVLFIATQDH